MSVVEGFGGDSLNESINQSILCYNTAFFVSYNTDLQITRYTTAWPEWPVGHLKTIYKFWCSIKKIIPDSFALLQFSFVAG